MSEESSKKSKKSIPKGRIMTKKPEAEEDVEEMAVIEQKIPLPPPLPPDFKNKPRQTKREKHNDESGEFENVDVQQFTEQEPIFKIPPLPQKSASKKEQPKAKIMKKKRYEANDNDLDSFDEQEEKEIIKMPPIRRHRGQHSRRSKDKEINNYDPGEEAEELEDFNSLQQQVKEQASKFTFGRSELLSQKGPPILQQQQQQKQRFASVPISFSEPIVNFQANPSANFQPKPFPNSNKQLAIIQKPQSNLFQQQYQTNRFGYETEQNNFNFQLTPLPSITTTENLTEILQKELESPTVKAFKDYFIEIAPLTSKIECDTSSILTDVHLYQLIHFDWPLLESIRIRECPNITPFALDYVQKVIDKQKNRSIIMNIELILHAHSIIQIKDDLIEQTINQIEPILGKTTKTSISKVLIYHVSSSNDSMLSPQQMLINQIRKSNDNYPLLLDYQLSTKDECQVALFECSNFILFKELSVSFHPHIIYLIVSNIDDVLKCFFSFDSQTFYAILKNQQIRLIINGNESHEQILSNLHTQLKKISKSAMEIYSKYVETTSPIISENDQYRRNHYLSSLLHIQSKCEMLQGKLTKEQCLIFKSNEPELVSHHLMIDAVKYHKISYTLPDYELSNEKILEINQPLVKLADELNVKSNKNNLNSATLAQNYLSQKLIHDKILDIHIPSHGKSYLIGDINWFCQIINQIFNTKLRTEKKMEYIIEQLKFIIGEHVRLIMKNDMKQIEINGNEFDIFQLIFTSWNLAYSISTDDQTDENNLLILFNSIRSQPSVPLATVWNESLLTDDFHSVIYFHLLHPCDSSILFRLYKLFPSQKLILASKDFLLIQEGAIEILVQYHHQIGQNTDISMTIRSVDINPSRNMSSDFSTMPNDSFEYVVKEYYMIIWAFLFKHDYAFRIEVKDQDSSTVFDNINGNTMMNSHWKSVELYHYPLSPTLTSVCSVCGLRPSATKSLYNACRILSPLQYTTDKTKDGTNDEKQMKQSDSLIFTLARQSFLYTDNHSMRPDGFNSFEVTFLSADDENQIEQSPILSTMQIGCLMNNFDIENNENILFEFGAARTKSIKTEQVNPNALFEEIRNFGGIQGLRDAKKKSHKKNELKELYSGLRLRLNIFFTSKPNTYEFVFSINDIVYSRQTIRCKTTRTMFQPIIQSPGIHNTDRKINLVVRHYRSALDKPTIDIPTTETKGNPWKVGMRLEAKDRKNPNILAIANIIEVYDNNRIRINFDGWTSTFDYDVEINNLDIHPCGYWEYVQRVLYKNVNLGKLYPHFTFTRYDKPKSYDRSFSWRNYLTELDQEPVPFECFTYIQTEGMLADFFPHGIAKSEFTRLSCRHISNVRVKYHKMNTIIQNEIANKILYEHRLELSHSTATTSPGVIFLPAPFNKSIFPYPCLKEFQNLKEFSLNLTCNHRTVSPMDSSDILFGAHLLDLEFVHIEKSKMNIPLITLCMLTAIDLARNQKHPIAPCTSKILANNSFDKRFIEYNIRRWLELSAYINCFHSMNFFNRRLNRNQFETNPIFCYTSYSDQDLFTTLRNNLSSISIDSSQTYFTQKEYLFGKYGECNACCLFRSEERTDQSDLSIEKRLELVGDFAPCIFYFELSKQEKSVHKHHIILDDQFFLRFTGLQVIDISNVTIDRFELKRKNYSCLKNLLYLSLENNYLSMINVDFQYLNQLIHLKFIANPFEILPLNCLSGKALQTVEFSQLGRLTEIPGNMKISSELRNFLMTESVLTTLPQTLGTDAQTKLTKLTLNGVIWWGAEGMSVNEVVKYDSFEKKFLPYLDNQELTNIYHMYDEDANGILSFPEILVMNAHLYRYIPRLRPNSTKIPNSGRSSVEPTNSTGGSDILKQDSFNIDTTGFPSAIFYLQNLTDLILEYQGIKIVPDSIKNLTSLSNFSLKYCIELETLSAHVGFLPLKTLNLTGCGSLKTPPIEITRRGHQQTMAFLRRLISGSTPCKRTKLMLVGLGGAGKTSLVRAFLQSYSETPPIVTDGIDIIKWKVPLKDANDVLEFSVWDFAGQSVYYHTHQFFLAKKAVYILAWNIRLGAEHAGLDFWLSSICCHAPNAPIFVVGTHSDQVSRFDLRQDDLKRRYPQISGFFHVSTHTGDNIKQLTDTIIETTLALPYMDEQIPKAWLTFEGLISECKEDILEYRQVIDIAQNAGIFDTGEILQAVQFLHDLGSLQYFSSEQLKRYVVINPQWIVNVMACIVSIKDSPVKDGRLFHSDVDIIWYDYASHLHDWILKLTEAFDLTFPVPDQNMNLVPCLLPEEEPEYTWNEDTNDSDIREMKVIYTFNYLPAGLFNRAQVRLFQFSDKSTIWRHGSLLLKNNHRAVIIRTDDRHIVIKIQGVRPDNILFLIHEVFENLVNESFFGVTYDIAFPCPDCIELGTNEPWQFSSSLINRAIELKSPSIQCHRFFHVASVTDLQALIPPDSKSNYDLHLEYSVRDLKSYKQNMAVDVVYIYPTEHIPTSSQIEMMIDPRKIKDDLAKRGLKIWSPDSMKEFKIENHFLVIKEARSIIFGVSTELVENPDNRNLYDAFQTITNILRKPIIPVLFGTDMKWKESDIGVALLDKLYVNMQNPKRYEHRIVELIDMIEQEKDSNDKKQFQKHQPTDVFISYCWLNSHDAVGKGTKPSATSLGWGDPRVLKDYLEARGLQVWMDITRLGKAGVLHDIVQGLKSTKLMIACVSDEYTQSEICRNEFLFAKNTLRLPVILAIFGSGDKWRVTEVGMCSLACPQVNFQYENPTAFEDIYNLLHSHLPKRPITPKQTATNLMTTSVTEQTTTAAYQELFELTQRKFLRLTSNFAEAMTPQPYPRLFAYDFMGEKEKSAQELARIELATQMNTQRQQQADETERDLEADRQRDEEVLQKEKEAAIMDHETEMEEVQEKVKSLCIRALCENEENWHPAGNPFEITEKVVIQNSSSYLSRIMLLLKHSDLALEILNTDKGEIELQKLAEIASATNNNVEVKDSYTYLRQCIMDCDPEEKYCGLKQCLMPSGKVLWLCEEHQNQPRVILVTGSVTGGYTRPQVEEKSEILKALTKLNERIGNNEILGPTLKVPTTSGRRRSSTEKQSTRIRSAHRNVRQESTLIKVQEQNISEMNEDTSTDVDHDLINHMLEDETPFGSKDCVVM